VPESQESQQPGRKRPTRRGRADRRRPTERESARPAAGGDRASAEAVPAEPERTYAEPGPEGPRLEEILARGFVLQAPWGGLTIRPDAEAAPAAEAPPPAHAVVAVRAPIDRTDPAEVFSVDTNVKLPDGTVLQILRRPFGFPSGRLPGDPGPVPVGFEPGREICDVLSPPAAARCRLGRGYR